MLTSGIEVNFLTAGLGSGGAEKQLLYIARALQHLGCSCNIFVLGAPNRSTRTDLLELCSTDGVKIFWSSGFRGRSPIAWMKTYFRLIGRRQSIFWAWGDRSELLLKLLPTTKLKIVSSLRLASPRSIKEKAAANKLRQSAVKLYVSNSQLNIDLFQACHSIAADRFFLLPNVIEPSPLRWIPRHTEQVTQGLRVCLLGNNRYWHKGYDTLLQVASIVNDRGLPISFEIAGEDYDGNLSREIATHGLASTVRHVGPIDNPYIFFQDYDLYMLTSRVEGTPNSLLEAMSFGLPVISTEVGDLATMFCRDNSQIRLAKVEGASELADHLASSYADWNETFEMAKRGTARMQELFGTESFERNMISLKARLESLHRDQS